MNAVRGALPVDPRHLLEPRFGELATLLIEFDPMLAGEVREHLKARADEWDGAESEDSPPGGKVERARRYRRLAWFIEALALTADVSIS